MYFESSPLCVRAVAENDGWSIFLEGLPIGADGASLEEAVAEMITALREYAAGWLVRLRDAPGHRENCGLIYSIGLIDDAQLRDWLIGSR
ncbi:hypothetical protein [Nocardia abscessus]|uniref:hypothetical protein n=1 Tax=Nocardia abscessus TaxID=120957 RepID=UPI0024577C35|nr:hypothetical protein [Nocardia abscessus]